MHSRVLVVFLLIFFYGRAAVSAGNIALTRHNFSNSAPTDNNLYSTEDELCVFCHTPHNTQPAIPLWNHSLSLDEGYSMYGSDFTTNPDRWSLEYERLDAPAVPTGSSKLCLSCHDGTIAIGSLNTSFITVEQEVTGTLNSGLLISAANLTKDLTDDHPISIPVVIHNSPLTNDELQTPADTSPVRLENQLVQCSSCHDPHSNQYNNFLVMSSENGGLCLECHLQTGWSTSAHAGSALSWTSPEGITKPVSNWACLACHQMHSASTPHLLQVGAGAVPGETEQVCFKCHGSSGGVPIIQGLADVSAEFTKTYRHPVNQTADIHYFTEPNPPVDTHVECEDCHDPHQVQTADHITAVDAANGSIIGIMAKSLGPNSYDGVLTAWTPPQYGEVQEIQYEYELCLKCHGTQSVMDLGRDHMEEIDVYFNPLNKASHGCITRNQKVNPYVTVNFTDPVWTEITTFACSDCHGSDSTIVKGPHGSTENWLLKKSTNPDRGGNYLVCYDCHNPEVYGEGGISGASSAFDLHTYDKHWASSIVFPPEVPAINCFLCHGDFSNGDDRNIIPAIYYTPGQTTGYTPGGLHGANSGRASRPTGTSGYHFLNGLAIRIVSPEDQLLTSGATITCGSALEGGYGCSQHTTKEQTYTR